MQELEFKKFHKIQRFAQEEALNKKANRPTLVDNIKANYPITITEKLDGANSCIQVIKDHDNFAYQISSHNQVLTDPNQNDLRGWYAFAENKVLPKIKEFLANKSTANFYFYGEWLVQHTVKYTQDMYNHWYLLSILDAEKDYIYTPDERFAVANEYGFRTPDVFYQAKNPAITLDEIKAYVGKSKNTLEEDHGEGIVIECNGVKAKIRSKEFEEVRALPKFNKEHKLSASETFIEETMTYARFLKQVNKFKDENKLPDLIFNNFSKLCKLLSNALYQDILEEESNNLPMEFDEKMAHRALSRQVVNYLKKLLQSNEDKFDF